MDSASLFDKQVHEEVSLTGQVIEGCYVMRTVVAYSEHFCDCGRDRWKTVFKAIHWYVDTKGQRHFVDEPYEVYQDIKQEVSYIKCFT